MPKRKSGRQPKKRESYKYRPSREEIEAGKKKIHADRLKKPTQKGVIKTAHFKLAERLIGRQRHERKATVSNPSRNGCICVMLVVRAGGMLASHQGRAPWRRW